MVPRREAFNQSWTTEPAEAGAAGSRPGPAQLSSAGEGGRDSLLTTLSAGVDRLSGDFSIQLDSSRVWGHFVELVAAGEEHRVEALAGEILQAAAPADPCVSDAPGGLRLVSWELAEILNATSSRSASAARLASEFAELAAVVGAELGEVGVSLLRFLAAETTEYFSYPPRSWPRRPRTWLDPATDAMSAWVATSGCAPETALVLAARISDLAGSLGRFRHERAGVALH